MNTSQLKNIFRKDKLSKHIFQGVFPSDMIVKIRARYPFACIVNTDPSDRSGSHWIAIYINRQGIGEFFDSYAKPPSYYGKVFVNFLNRVCRRWTYNKIGLQGPFSATCGQYCVYYLWYRIRGLPMSEIIQHFTKDVGLNDYLVNEFVRKKFPLETRVYDLNMLQSSLPMIE